MSGCFDTNMKCSCLCHTNNLPRHKCCNCHGDRFFTNELNIHAPFVPQCNCGSRLMVLEKFHDYWKKLPKWEIQELVNVVNEHQDKIKELKEDIDALSERMKTVEKKLDNINFLPDLINRAVKCFQDADGLRPHKCPVCEGLGKATLFKDGICNICEGRGIVWG